jgi:glutathione peroxidase
MSKRTRTGTAAVLTAAALGMLIAVNTASAVNGSQGGKKAMSNDIYTYTMKLNDGSEKSLADYEGKVLLIVNTASECGFTPQYKALEALYEKYKDRGFEVLAFPANNFGGQEPGTDAQIKTFCTTKYSVTFPLFAKTSVKGADINPLYAYLTGMSGFDGEITWNFNKFLVDRSGKVVARFDSKVDPMDDALVRKVEALLAQKV